MKSSLYCLCTKTIFLRKIILDFPEYDYYDNNLKLNFQKQLRWWPKKEVDDWIELVSEVKSNEPILEGLTRTPAKLLSEVRRAASGVLESVAKKDRSYLSIESE